MGENHKIKLDECLIYSLFVSTNIIGSAAKKLVRKLDISLSQYVLLMTIAANDGIAFSDVMAQLRIESSALSAMVKNLAQKQLVLKVRAEHDERVVFLKLSDRAENLMDELFTVQSKLHEFIDLDEEDRITLMKILKKINLKKTSLY